MLGQHLPAEVKASLAEEQKGVQTAVMAIIDRHNSQCVEFSQNDDMSVEFMTDIPFVLNESVKFEEEVDNLSVAQSRPTPPRPKTIEK